MDVAQRNREMAAKDAEIEALKASRDRLRAYIKVVNPYSMDIVPQRVNLAAVKAFMALEDADLADADPAPDAGQEVG